MIIVPKKARRRRLVWKPTCCIIAAFLSGCYTPDVGTSLRISKSDHVNPRLGPEKHYEHVIRDHAGNIMEVYQYYLDGKGNPVLDGNRVIYRSIHDPGLLIRYRKGRVIGKGEIIVTGG